MDTITLEILPTLDPFRLAQQMAKAREENTHQLPDGRQIECINERTAKLLTVDGDSLTYLRREYVEYEPSLTGQWLKSREVVR